MKKACLVVSPPYTNGAIFSRGDSYLNRDNCLQIYFDLQDAFHKHGVNLNTHDINLPDSCDYVIYLDMPRSLPATSDTWKSFLMITESEVIIPNNWKVSNHVHFKKIFTWHDDFVDGNRYFKLNFTSTNKPVNFLAFADKTKFCTLIAGSKKSSHPLELYSQRIDAIRWFETNHPDKFEFYGAGWDIHTFNGPKIIRGFNRLPFLRTLRRWLAEKYPSYKGKVDSKIETLRQYKFSICYENAQGIPGYITEKIFDSMSSGCIPVYWGAPNIADYIPEACYIDKRKFKTYEELYKYLEGMSEAEYNSRLMSIMDYLNSTAHQEFTPRFAAKMIAENVLMK